MPNSNLIFAPETGTNKVVHVKVKATGGTWKFAINGRQIATGIAYNVSGADATTAAVALSNVDAGDVVITGGPGDTGGSTDYVFTFGGKYQFTNSPTVTTDATALTGSTHTAAVSVATPGVAQWGAIPDATTGGWREISVDSDGFKTRKKDLTFTGTMSDAGSAASDKYFRAVTEGGDGVISAPGISNGLGALLATTCDSAVVTHTGTLAYTHTFTWGPLGPPAFRSVAAVITRQRAQDTDMSDEWLHPGCRATQVDIGADVDGNLAFKFTVDSKAPVLTEFGVDRTIVQVIPDTFYAWSDGDVTIGGDDLFPSSVSFALPTAVNVNNKGINRSGPRRNPMRSGTRPALTGSFKELYNGPTAYQDWVAGTVKTLVCDFQGPVPIEATTYPSITITADVRYTGDDPQFNIGNPTEQSSPFEIIVNEDHPLTIVVVTSDSAL